MGRVNPDRLGQRRENLVNQGNQAQYVLCNRRGLYVCVCVCVCLFVFACTSKDSMIPFLSYSPALEPVFFSCRRILDSLLTTLTGVISVNVVNVVYWEILGNPMGHSLPTYAHHTYAHHTYAHAIGCV